MTAVLPERATSTSDRLALAAQRRAAERTYSLAELLRTRPDLRGTYAPADFAVEAVRWGA